MKVHEIYYLSILSKIPYKPLSLLKFQFYIINLALFDQLAMRMGRGFSFKIIILLNDTSMNLFYASGIASYLYFIISLHKLFICWQITYLSSNLLLSLNFTS